MRRFCSLIGVQKCHSIRKTLATTVVFSVMVVPAINELHKSTLTVSRASQDLVQADPGRLVERGIEKLNRENYQEAIEVFTEAVKNNPDLAIAYFKRGFAHFKLGEYQEAITVLNQVLRINPEDATAYYNRGLVYAQLGEYQEAIADFTQALQINPEDATAYYNRGIAHA